MAAATAQPQVADDRDKLYWRQAFLAGTTVRGGENKGLVLRQTVNAVVQKTADSHSQQGKGYHPDDFHIPYILTFFLFPVNSIDFFYSGIYTANTGSPEAEYG
jgi:antirestriction protein ArdC